MKVRTYRFGAPVILILSFLMFLSSADKLCFLLSGKQQEILFDYSLLVPLLADTAAVILILTGLKRYDYSTFSKKGLSAALTAVSVLAVLPIFCIFGRTEITPDSVVRHRCFASPVTYNVSDCEKVTVNFYMDQHYPYRSPLSDPYLALDYELTFPDGYMVFLRAQANGVWWTVAEKMNDSIEKAGVEKTVYAADRKQFTDRQWFEYGLDSGLVGNEEVLDKLCRQTPK